MRLQIVRRLIMITLDKKRFKITKGEDLHKVIAMALCGYPLNGNYESWLENDDGSMKNILTSSEYRKLRWAAKSQVENVVVYCKVGGVDDTEEYTDLFSEFKRAYGNEVCWIKRAKNYRITKRVIAYEGNDVLEYDEKSQLEELNFMVIPIHIWNQVVVNYKVELVD